MILLDKFTMPGEHPFLFPGMAGQIQAVLTMPANVTTKYVALLGHPHSLQGGTMNNKVVTTLARACKELAIPSLRFNFRGVGESEGVYDAGIGESDDMLTLMHLCQQELPDGQFIFAGFSFGSYVAYRAAAQSNPKLLITIAPPVHHYDYQELAVSCPWMILQGDEDEIVPVSLVMDFANNFVPSLPVYRFAQTSHFFHSQLVALKNQLMHIISAQGI